MMSEATQKRSVLDALLSGEMDENPPDYDDLARLCYRDRKDAPRTQHRSFRLTDFQSSPFAPPEDDDRIEMHESFRLTMPTGKIKATVYFPNKLHVRLKSAKHHLKKLLPGELRSKVTMSDIVTLSLKIVLHDFENKENDSVLCKLMDRNLRKA